MQTPSIENIRMELRVPDALATVTCEVSTKEAGIEIVRHFNVVPLVHAAVAQSTAATAADGVRSVVAKPRPLRVAVDPPEKGALPAPTSMELTAGA